MRVDTLQLTDKQAVRGWLKGFGDEVLLVRHVFINKDGSTGLLNLVCSDLTLDGEQVDYDLQETVVIRVGAGFPHPRVKSTRWESAPGRGKWKSFTNH